MAGGLVGNMSYGAERSAARAGRYGAEQQGAAEAGGEPFASAPRGTVAGQADARTDLEYNWDKMLDVADSPAYQYSMMAGSVALPAVWAGGSAMLGGATLAGAGTAALTVAGPLTVAVAVGFAGGMAGAWAGGHVGNWIGDMMGLEPLAGPSDDPACKGDKIFHVRTNLVLGMMVAAVVVGAVVALAAASIAATIFTGGLAAPFIIAGIAGLAGGLAGGFVGGMANSLGQRGEEKGEIADGSPNVQFEGRPVSHVTAPVACRDHGPKQVAEGSETVFVNGWPIGRKGHKTTCDGTIQTGCTTIKLDQTTSAIRLDIDGGWAQRIVRSVIAISDFLPFPKGSKGDGTPSGQATRGDLPPNCRRGCKDPIDVVTGQLIDRRVDLEIPGTIPLRLERSHARDSGGPLGIGWAGTVSAHLRLVPDGVEYQDENGTIIPFHTPDAQVNAWNLRMPWLRLTGQRGGVLTIRDTRARLTHSFASRVGDMLRLDRTEDDNGNHIALTWGHEGLRQIAHSDGFALSVTSQDGLMRRAVLQGPHEVGQYEMGQHETGQHEMGLSVAWGYTAAGQLARVVSTQTGTLAYHYDASGRITAWERPGLTRVQYRYDAKGRIERTWSDSGQYTAVLDYDPAARVNTVVNADGTTRRFGYDARGLICRETDELGNDWLTEHDLMGNVVARTDPLGHVTRTVWDEMGNPLSQTDPDGATFSYDYNADGLLRSVTDPAGFQTELFYDQRGNLVATLDAAGNRTIWRLGLRGEVLRVDYPEGGQERFYYDAMVRPSACQTVEGGRRQMTFDIEGRITSLTDESGALTRWDYTRSPDNPLGQVRAIDMADGTRAEISYDAQGALAELRLADGTVRNFATGAHSLPVAARDPKGGVLRTEYDADARPIAWINPRGERYDLRRDAAGQIIAERDFAGRETHYSRDATGRIIRRTAPDGTLTDYDWSAGGRLLKLTARGPGGQQQVTLDYDARGLIRAADNGAAKVEFAFDPLGRVVSESVLGREITSRHSFRGRVERAGAGPSLGLDHSAAGHLSEIRIDDHAPLSLRRDARGQETLRTSAAGFAQVQSWTPVGQLDQQIAGPLGALPPEIRDGLIPDMMRREAATRLGAVVHRSYQWSATHRPVAIDDRASGITRIHYDARGQVSEHDRMSLHSRDRHHAAFTYDPAGDLTAIIEDMRSDPVETAQGGLVRRRGRIFYQHDACGRVIEKRIEEPGFRPRIWTYRWNGLDQLIALTTPEGARWRYDYDAFGRRIRRLRIVEGGGGASAGGNVGASVEGGVAYQWDGNDLISEAPVDADGGVSWDKARHWIHDPATGRAIAQITGQRLDYIVSDHLGTPQELVSEDGESVRWRARLSLWGRVESLRGGAEPANDDAPPVDCPIRFPGQWEDDESGLHYNRFRYYDPDATQYLSPDPIGLNGGMRPQAYVPDPNSQIDPLGLTAQPPGPLTPADFGTAVITDDPVLHRLWTDAQKGLAESPLNNKYKEYLKVLEAGGTPTKRQLDGAFSAVNGRFLPAARDAGYTIAQVHHWNYNRNHFPELIVHPGHLVPVPDRATHTAIHRATTSNRRHPFGMFIGPIDPRHQLPVDGSSYPLPPGYFEGTACG